MRNKMILLVEDNANDALLTLLSIKKHEIADRFYTVSDGVEALDFLFCKNNYANRDPQDLPWLILLDFNLPKLNGLEVLRYLRADERTSRLPIITFTSSHKEQDLVNACEAGLNSIMRKPFDYVQFGKCVQQLGIEDQC